MERRRSRDFWLSEESRSHIAPTGEAHEGFDIGLCLRLLCGPEVCEIGCGYGRLAPYFEHYVGLDVSGPRIDACRDRYPGVQFHRIEYDDDYPLAACYLFCGVLLHVPDAELQLIVERTRGSRVVIAEVMNPAYADNHITFHRDPEGYGRFGQPTVYEMPYARYQDTYTFLRFDP